MNRTHNRNILPSAGDNPQRDHHLVWTESQWEAVLNTLRDRVLSCKSDDAALRPIIRRARSIMRAYTTSFFIVSRFLPPPKRDRVEIIYSVVRYPDEVVDSFPLSADERAERLHRWRDQYESGLEQSGVIESVRNGVPAFLAAFIDTLRSAEIPADHYRSFLDAMHMDIYPRPFESLDDLIDSYVYGSATVVGYFLTHIYGASRPDALDDALEAARDLGIALQLTNFVRDVTEDQRRGRLYLPLDMFGGHGIKTPDADNPAHAAAFTDVIHQVARYARDRYRLAKEKLDAYAPDCRIAIRSCIAVYGRLNDRILDNPEPLRRRESVPLRDKLAVLPKSKYWRIPAAYLLR